MNIFVALLPALIGLFAALRGVDVFSALTEGAERGVRTVARILPPLAALLPAVYMLRASGALAALEAWCAPALSRLGIPPETVPLLLLRPLSGSAALAVGAELMGEYGPDSLVGRTAAVMLGSTETTFYVLTVYFGAAGVKKTRHAPLAALCADAAGFLAAAWCARLLWGAD